MNKLSKENFFFFQVLSFAIVAFGQPAWFGILGYIAVFCGYSLFWASSFYFENKIKRFYLAVLWFVCVHGVGLSWMTSTRYLTSYILIFYFILLLIFGLQFALTSLLVDNKRFSYLRILAIASLWTLFEWSRLFILSGYTWNPSALALANNTFSSQWVTLFGIYGLSFWVILVNGLSFKAFFIDKTPKAKTICSLAFFCPYLFGFVYHNYHQAKMHEQSSYHVLLVQPAIMPHQRDIFSKEGFVSPLYQWKRILYFIREGMKEKVDCIILPESTLPFGARFPFYSLASVQKTWEEMMGKQTFCFNFLLYPPFAFLDEDKQWRLTNSFWAKAISDYYGTEVIIGLDDWDAKQRKIYNAAFFLQPHEWRFQRYEKQILVPLGEYFPFSFCAKIAAKYGITEQFAKGKHAKLFLSKKRIPLGLSICVEETFGKQMRKMRKKGAELFVTMSNDAWFPNSKLPLQHYLLGKLQAQANGAPLVRACNTGVTAGVDALGRERGALKEASIAPDHLAGAIYVEVPRYHFSTLYTLLGDKAILSLSSIFLLIFLGFEGNPISKLKSLLLLKKDR